MPNVAPEQLTLYYSPTCPYCHRVLDALHSMGFPPDLAKANANGIALKDSANRQFREELIEGGGKKTVPCIAITSDEGVRWQYESLDIIDFLQDNLA